MNNLDRYRQTIRHRIGLAGLYFILMALTSLCLNHYSQNTLINGYVYGFTFVIELIILCILIKDIRILKNDQKLRKAFVQEHDERKMLINYRTAYRGMIFILLGLSFATLIAGYLNEIVFLTLLSVLIIIILTLFGLKTYYSHHL